MIKMPSCQVIREFLLEKNEHMVAGTSMRPFLNHGQKVIISHHTTKLIPGHLYVFIYRHRLVMHRLVALQGQFAFFMGDHSRNLEKVPFSAIVAKYEGSYQYFRLAIINLLNRWCYALENKQAAFMLAQNIRIKCVALIFWRIRK